ncbi:MAG: MAE_28990/MAE_18760 family HEPN-like nuclease [Bacillota bacterium]
MEARDKFNESIDEVKILVKKAEQDEINSNVYFKSCVLLMCAKLEKYVKDSTKEYFEDILNLGLSAKFIPHEIKVAVIENEINFITNKTVSKYISEPNFIKRSEQFALIWNKKYSLKDVNYDEYTVSIANNGETAFKKCYYKVGLHDIMDGLNDYEKKQDPLLGGIETKESYGITTVINKIIYIRHNIIHDDAQVQITSSDLTIYIDVVSSFVTQIDERLESKVNEMKSQNNVS